MSSPTLFIRHYSEIPEWDAYVNAHPKGTVLHCKAMIRCKEATKNHVPFAFGAIDTTGNLCALLVSVRVTTSIAVVAPMASRAIMYAEPIFDESPTGRLGVRELVRKHDQYMAKRTLFAEVRPLFEDGSTSQSLFDSGYQRAGYLNYEIALALDSTEMFSRLGPKRRNNVRAAGRKGVQVQQLPACEGVKVLYDLICASYARSQVPVVDRSLFDAAATQFGDAQMRVLTAFYQQRPVASGCFLAYKDRVICWYAGTQRIAGVPAMTSVFWEAMRIYGEEGYRVFDFAGGGWEGTDYGPGKFKEKFNGTVTNYGRYRKIYSPWKLRVATTVYNHMRNWIAPKSGTKPDNTAVVVAGSGLAMKPLVRNIGTLLGLGSAAQRQGTRGSTPDFAQSRNLL